MAYEKQNFTNGEVLDASQLNHIENGIVELETLTDRTTGKKYTLYVDNGKLMMEEVS